MASDEIRWRRRRAILSAVLMVPVLAWFVGTPFVYGLDSWYFDWPWYINVGVLIFWLASVAIGWPVIKATWWGDQSVYVDEPEVDDGE